MESAQKVQQSRRARRWQQMFLTCSCWPRGAADRYVGEAGAPEIREIHLLTLESVSSVSAAQRGISLLVRKEVNIACTLMSTQHALFSVWRSL